MIKKLAEEQKDKVLNGLTVKTAEQLNVSKTYIDTQADSAKV